MSLPFFEQQINQNIYLRKFLNETEDEEYVWHRDQEDRIIEVLSSNGWKFQQENELPIVMEEGMKISIPKLSWHRVIKGKDDLLLRIIKL
jgi:hypothetical protein